MRIDVKGLVNTAEPVPVFRFKEETGLRGFESGAAEVQARYKEFSFPDRFVGFLELLKCGIHLIRLGRCPSSDEMIQ